MISRKTSLLVRYLADDGPVPVGDPKHPVPFPFRGLTDADFDELTFLVALIDDPLVVKLRAPDGGLDTVRPDDVDPTRARWGIQAKLHREHIKWPNCRESLDRAADQWRPDRVTFAFPRDLTIGQYRSFVKHLVRRHPRIRIDHWGSTRLTAALIGSEQGRTIAKKFFHAEDPADIVDRATRAGGPLRTPVDLFEREDAIGDFLRTAGPHFDFQSTRGPRTAGRPPETPGSAMRLEFARGEQQLFIDAIPKTPDAARHYGPKGSIAFTDPERANRLLSAVQDYGGRASLGQATIVFEQIPPPFDQLLASIDGEVTIRAKGDAAPWSARLTADTDTGCGSLDIDLVPAPAEKDWDMKLAGQRNGVKVELRFVWDHDTDTGKTALTWEFTRATGSTAERARALDLMVAIHGVGTITLEDREGVRPTLQRSNVSRLLPPDLPMLRNAYRDLFEIEAFAGATFGPPPDEFAPNELRNLAFLADQLRQSRTQLPLTSMKLVVRADGLEEFRSVEAAHLLFREQLYAHLFGRDLHVGQRVTQPPPMRIKHAVKRPDRAWDVTLVPSGTPNATIEYLRPDAPFDPASAAVQTAPDA